MLRQLALMILTLDTQLSGCLTGKRKQAGRNNDHLEALLLQIATRLDAEALAPDPQTPLNLCRTLLLTVDIHTPRLGCGNMRVVAIVPTLPQSDQCPTNPRVCEPFRIKSFHTSAPDDDLHEWPKGYKSPCISLRSLRFRGSSAPMMA